jgi:hypothetical protein
MFVVVRIVVADIWAQVQQIKEKVEEKEGIPPVQQRLIFGGKQMYAISDFSPFAVAAIHHPTCA